MARLPLLLRSPRWLAKVGRTEEAVGVLARIQAGGDVDDPLVVAEWEEISMVLGREREGQRGWRRFFGEGMWRRTLARACCSPSLPNHSIFGSRRKGSELLIPISFLDVRAGMATAEWRQRS